MEKRRGPQRATVVEDDVGRRLDNFLLARLKGVPRSRIYRMIRSGEVRVNGGRSRPNGRLSLGDEVRIPPVRTGRGSGSRGPAAHQVAWLEDCIVYEDQDLLGINKPAGLAVHGGSGVSHGVIELLRAARGEDAGLELVHRLDRETSGCLLISKRRSVLRNLHAQFRDGGVRKEYVAVLAGRLSGNERFIDAPLSVHHRRGGERHVTVDANGKDARSRFTPRRRYQLATVTDVVIETGRTHQIRVHAAHIGHPVLGDSRYADAKSAALAAQLSVPGLCLHAAALTIDSPRHERVIRVEAPMPAEQAQFIAGL